MRTAPVLLALVLLSGCAAGSETVSAPGSSPVPALSPAASAAPSVASSPTPRVIAVTATGGAVTGTDGREEVEIGEEVVLRITSDVAEEYHVHGYDLVGPLPAGQAVDIPLTASIPGGFEVELHESGKLLFQLRVA